MKTSLLVSVGLVVGLLLLVLGTALSGVDVRALPTALSWSWGALWFASFVVTVLST